MHYNVQNFINAIEVLSPWLILLSSYLIIARHLTRLFQFVSDIVLRSSIGWERIERQVIANAVHNLVRPYDLRTYFMLFLYYMTYNISRYDIDGSTPLFFDWLGVITWINN